MNTNTNINHYLPTDYFVHTSNVMRILGNYDSNITNCFRKLLSIKPKLSLIIDTRSSGKHKVICNERIAMYYRVLSISDKVMRQKYCRMTLFNSSKKYLRQVEKLTSTPGAMLNVEY